MPDITDDFMVPLKRDTDIPEEGVISLKCFVVVLVIVSLTVLAGSSTFAQSASVDSKLVNQAGKQLEDYASQYYTGFWLSIGGTILIAAAPYVSPVLAVMGFLNANSVLVIAGLLMNLAGDFYQFLAAGNIGAAGASLIQAASNQ